VEKPRERVVASPMFGIFHRAPSPDSAPFVETGHKVKSGDKLCLIEAMKSFNLIHAEAEGTVTAILVENGQEVELGQPLFHIGR
jgi:acetyl-CoA carboxylase biotin carboxyl carrier protein